MEPNLENVSNEIVNASTPTPSPALEKPKKSKGFIATIVILAILAIAGIATAIYFYLDANNKTVTNSELQAKLDLLKTETGAELIETTENGTTVTVVEDAESVETAIKSIINQIYDALPGATSGGFYSGYYRTFGSFTMIKMADADIYTSTDESYGITSEPNNQEAIDQGRSIVVSILTSNGYQLVPKPDGPIEADLYYNQDDNIYCEVYGLVNCSSEKLLPTENKNLILDLAKAVNPGGFIYADPKNIKDSPISPYQTLSGSGAGYVALFYRVSPDADWQFFTGAQAALPCSEYTGDIAKAFAGDICYDESTGQDSTVQP